MLVIYLVGLEVAGGDKAKAGFSLLFLSDPSYSRFFLLSLVTLVLA